MSLEVLRDPAFNAVHFEWFNFNPDIYLKLSKTSIRASKDCLDPSVKKVASSANNVSLISCPSRLTPLILLL